MEILANASVPISRGCWCRRIFNHTPHRRSVRWFNSNIGRINDLFWCTGKSLVGDHLTVDRRSSRETMFVDGDYGFAPSAKTS